MIADHRLFARSRPITIRTRGKDRTGKGGTVPAERDALASQAGRWCSLLLDHWSGRRRETDQVDRVWDVVG